ncbi:orcokinin peptides-like isoform X2 [Galleria mellonella]|uniref:Orcokinin A n=1 Tax=Galleria mellonella TaxID=7137 RepID=A0AA50F5M5_GALME|nr:orcokinin peptides-like isoform X2 [Galleria mellonella]WLY76861.1 orcokinin A [Galleria mellonella]
MRGAGGALAVAVAALLVCCSADPHQESEVSGSEHNSADRYDAGHKSRNLDPLGSGNLVREVREIRDARHFIPYLLSRRYEYASPYGGNGKREYWPLSPVQYGGYYADGLPKRNFDEIDRSGLDNFVKKRNFDEIDQTSMPFPYATKRFYRFGPNYLDIDSPVSSFDKKRYRLDFPMDEIDLSHFPIGSKRSQDSFRPMN